MKEKRADSSLHKKALQDEQAVGCKPTPLSHESD
jgi:hypothetical protein